MNNNATMQELNSYNCPLTGSNMISAGAGTGKTYNIQILALREILMGTPIEKILVVTFTELATQELQDRIRRILQNALRVCEALLKCNAFTHDVLENSPNGIALLNDKELEQALPCFGLGTKPTDNLPQNELPQSLDDIVQRKHLLETALRDFDNAPISTIHGFCSRMLKENTFESGIRYGLELRSSCKALVKSLVCDFYRDFCNSTHSSRRFLLLKLLKYTPDRIVADLREILGNSDAKVNWGSDIPNFLNADSLANVPALQAIEQNPIWDRFPNVLQKVSDDELVKFCDEAKFDHAKALFYKQIASENWLLDAYDDLKDSIKKATKPPAIAFDEKSLSPVEIELRTAFLEAFYPAQLDATNTNERSFPAHSIPGLLDKYRRIILKLAHSFAQKELANAKETDGFMTFEDLLLTLKNRILCSDGEEFRKLIRDKFDCVMIDEFQDTDHTQSTIFSRLFDENCDDGPKRLLIMIGDEKQAIYKFRGGDVQTFQKMTGTAQNKYTLQKNFRSTADFIKAMNDFWLKTCEGRFFEPADIRFDEIAVGKDDGNCLKQLSDGAPLNGPALLSRGKQDNKDAVFQQMAAEILQLKQNFCKASQKDGQEQRDTIQFKDIAILVRTKTDVDAIRRTLRDSGIPSVFMQAQSIFKTAECRWMLDFMDAILEPGNQSKALRLLASGLFGFNSRQFACIHEKCLATFQSFLKEMNALWHQKSFFAMFTKFCNTPWQRQLASDWQGGLPPEIAIIAENTPAMQIVKNATDSERSLSLLNQTAETLMQVSTERHMEPGALYSFLENKIRANQSSNSSFSSNDDNINSTTEDENDDEEFPVHLTTQDDAVQILTIHKSKGLEYPFVFVPNFTSSKGNSFRNSIYHDDESKGQLRTVNVDVIDETTQKKCDDEAIAENKRLMYVAITRAKYFCRFIGTNSGMSEEDKHISSEYKNNGWDALDTDEKQHLRSMPKGKKTDKKLLQEFVERQWIELSEEELVLLNTMSGRKNTDKQFLEEKIVECLTNLPSEQRPSPLDFLENWNQHPEILLPEVPFPPQNAEGASEQPLLTNQTTTDTQQPAIHAESLPKDFRPDNGSIPTSFTAIAKGKKNEGTATNNSAIRSKASCPVSEAQASEAPSCSVSEAQVSENFPTNLKTDDDQDEGRQQDGPALTPYAERTPIFKFPGGTSTGTCWHEIMENLDFTQWNNPPTDDIWAPIETALVRYNQLDKATHDERIYAFREMLSTVAQFPFAFPPESHPFRLCDVPKENTLREFNFTFMMRNGIAADDLTALLQKDGIAVPEDWSHTIPRQPLTGSIDFLLQEPESQKFYILDWKTNIIGADADNFTPEGVEAEVKRHFYSLQCVLYALAFIQYFRQITHTADYPKDMREHYAKEAYDAFGGCADVFLRGLNAQNGYGIHYLKPSWDLLNQLDKRLGVSFQSHDHQ